MDRYASSRVAAVDEWKYTPARDLGLPIREQFQSVHRESGLIGSMTRHLWWAIARMYMRVWHRLNVIDPSHLPSAGPFVMIANHGSHLDTLAMAVALPIGLRERAFPIAAGDVFFETTLRRSFSAMMLNALPMWRRNCGRHAVQNLRTRLADDACVFILFPEGTRTRTGDMGSFKAGLGMLVAGTSVQVIPCRLEGSFQAMPPGRAFASPARITLRIGEPLTFADTPNSRKGWQEIADRSQDAIIELGRQ